MTHFQNPLPEQIYRTRAVVRDDDVRGPYFRDQTAIIHATPFRRLKHKTQVFFSPQNDHICTRIEHALHVATIAATICRQLGLDSDLAQAVALGHDLGHAPFGHAGEEYLDGISREMGLGWFVHELHSLRVVDKLANDGRGLNLTYAVRDGIVSHCGERFEQAIKPTTDYKDLSSISDRATYPTTYEGCIVRVSDKIAYLGRDIEDAIVAGLVEFSNIPTRIRQELGSKNGEIIDTLVRDVVVWSEKHNQIGFSDDKHELILKLKAFNYQNIYEHPELVEYQGFCKRIIETLYYHLLGLVDNLQLDYEAYTRRKVPFEKRFGRYLKTMSAVYNSDPMDFPRIILDYIAGMTDAYALKCIEELFLPAPIPFEY